MSTARPPGGGAPDARYEARAALHLAEATRSRAEAGRLSALRLLAAVGCVAALTATGYTTGAAHGVAIVGALLLAVAFTLLVGAHRRADRRAAESRRRHAASVRGAARVRRDWSALPVPNWGATVRGAPLPPAAEDLGVVGRGSLSQLLDVVTPAAGGPRLLEWLLDDPPPASALRGRQVAVAELAGREDYLEWCATAADAARVVSPRTLERFVRWAEDAPAAERLDAVRVAAWVGPALTLVAVVAAVGGALPAGAALAAAAILNTAAAAAARRRLRPMLAPVADLPVLLRAMVALMARYAAEPVAASAWRAVVDRLARGGGSEAFARLERVLTSAEVRYSPMLHHVVNAVVVWDAHVLGRLDAWRRHSGPAVRAWFDAIADAEALTALATLAHDNPEWVFPELLEEEASAGDETDRSAPTLVAEALAHPLLRPDRRVGNPVRLGGGGSVLVVSGSNMAGKTTLLRAIGLDVLLAQAGGPACAVSMRWRRVRVRTSVHVHDALSEGVSLFLAELRRLREIVDAAGQPADAPVLYLLDEVLHGTNSRDRRSATRAVLAHLRARGAVGVVTTHDIELADDPGLAPDAAHVHFREQYAAEPNGPRMTFDYRVQAGPATGANALALLEALGLGAPREER